MHIDLQPPWRFKATGSHYVGDVWSVPALLYPAGLQFKIRAVCNALPCQATANAVHANLINKAPKAD
jgi:hypothetical protein